MAHHILNQEPHHGGIPRPRAGHRMSAWDYRTGRHWLKAESALSGRIIGAGAESFASVN